MFVFVFVCVYNVFVCVHNEHSLLLRGSFRNDAPAVCTTPRCEMADSDEPKKRAGRPLKKKRGTSRAQNVPGEQKQKAVREKGSKIFSPKVAGFQEETVLSEYCILSSRFLLILSL